MSRWEEFLKLKGWRSGFSSVDNALRHYARKIRSEKTREIFCSTLMLFCKYCGLDPDSLVALAPERASRLSQEYTDHLRDKGYSVRYVNVSQAYMKTFFKENGFVGERELRVERYHQPARYRKKPEYIPTPEEIYRMGYAAGSAKNRAMLFTLYTAGLRNSTLRALRYGDVKKELEADMNVIMVPVYPEMKKINADACKGDIPYYSFIEAETVKALKEYVEERKQVYGDISDEEPLFCSDSNQIPTDRQRYTLVSKNGLARMVKRAAKQAGIEQWKNVTPHSLRKAFESALRNNRLDPKDQEFLMGHILPGSQDPYYDKSKVEELRRKYAQVNFFPQRGFITEEMRNRQLLDTARLLGFGDERLKRLEEVLARAKNVDEAIEKFRRLQEKPNREDPPRKNNIKIVKGDEELIKHMKKGWTLIKELNHDKYLLKIDQSGEAEK